MKSNADTSSPAEQVGSGEPGAVEDVIGVKGERKGGALGHQVHGGTGRLMSTRLPTESPWSLSTAIDVDQPRRNVDELDVVAVR